MQYKRDVHLLAVQTDSFTSTTAGILGRVGVHHRVAALVDADQTLVPRLTGILVVDGTMCRVVPVPEIKVVKEAASGLFLSVDVSSTQTSRYCSPRYLSRTSRCWRVPVKARETAKGRAREKVREKEKARGKVKGRAHCARHQ